MRARWICFEGTEGVGKTTHVAKLVDHLRSKGYSVLSTKEPGTSHLPLTVELRGIILDAANDSLITPLARELIAQSIRSIHLEKLIVPALKEYDFIVQDRGVISGLAYGAACGHSLKMLIGLLESVCQNAGFPGIKIYDDVVYLTGNPTKHLKKATACKSEFEDGDAMEMKGNDFIVNVGQNMDRVTAWFNTSRIDVDEKSVDAVFQRILDALKLEP